jgi:hypothetical protein
MTVALSAVSALTGAVGVGSVLPGAFGRPDGQTAWPSAPACEPAGLMVHAVGQVNVSDSPGTSAYQRRATSCRRLTARPAPPGLWCRRQQGVAARGDGRSGVPTPTHSDRPTSPIAACRYARHDPDALHCGESVRCAQRAPERRYGRRRLPVGRRSRAAGRPSADPPASLATSTGYELPLPGPPNR